MLKMKKIRSFYIVLVLLLVSLCLSSCFSLLKADRMVYAGSIGKKVDAAIIDSIQRIETNSER